jgi:hypothetical protein
MEWQHFQFVLESKRSKPLHTLKLKLLIRIFVSLAMLTLALRLVDMNQLKQSLLSIPLRLWAWRWLFFLGPAAEFLQMVAPTALRKHRNALAARRQGLLPRHCCKLFWAWHGWRRFGARSRARKQVKTEPTAPGSVRGIGVN